MFCPVVLYPAERNAEYSYPHYTTVLNLTYIEFLMNLKDIFRFEHLNMMSINATCDIENGQILPLWLIKDKRDKHVNVSYLQDSRNDGVGYFACIKNLSRLVRSQNTRNKNKKFFGNR